MKAFIVYDSTTGEIKRTGTCADSDLPLQAEAGESVIEGQADDRIHYVNGSGQVTAKQPMPGAIDVTTVPADETTPVTITGLPNPTTVRVSGNAGEVVVQDQTLQLTFDTPGTYVVNCRSTIYQDKAFTINAT